MSDEAQMTMAEARERLSRGERLRMVVGENPADPTLILHVADGQVISEAVAGWSAGVTEPICPLDSDFLETFLLDRHSIAPVINERT